MWGKCHIIVHFVLVSLRREMIVSATNLTRLSEYMRDVLTLLCLEKMHENLPAAYLTFDADKLFPSRNTTVLQYYTPNISMRCSISPKEWRLLNTNTAHCACGTQNNTNRFDLR